MYIVTGSITSAVRLSKAIENYSKTPSLVLHTPAQIRKGGCSYCVKSNIKSVDIVYDLASQTGVKIKNIYEEKKENGGRVYYDISR